MELVYVSAIFIFVCFVVVWVGGAHDAPSLGESVFQLGEHAVDAFLVIYVVDQGLAEDAAHYLQHRRVEVQSRIHAFVRAQKRRLESETVYQLELSPHHDARSRLAALLDDERAVFEAEHVDVLVKQPDSTKHEQSS